MSRPSALRLSRGLFATLALLLTGSLGCWEQWSESWFPQMKWQKAVQAFERLNFKNSDAALLPPEGSVPVGAGPAPVENIEDPGLDRLVNPRTDVARLARQRPQAVHDLLRDVSRPERHGRRPGRASRSPLKGPFAGVLPLAVVAARSDGHVYTTIRYGRRRMPSYKRIPSNDRWDIINYVRYMIQQKGIAQ